MKSLPLIVFNTAMLDAMQCIQEKKAILSYVVEKTKKKVYSFLFAAVKQCSLDTPVKLWFYRHILLNPFALLNIKRLISS